MRFRYASLIAVFAAGAVSVIGRPLAQTIASPGTGARGLTSRGFASPAAYARPWVRWNLPASAEVEELKSELRDVAAAGIAGVELGQGAFPNEEQLAAILTTANELGITIGLSHGAVAAPPDFSASDVNARKTLVAGRTTVRSGESLSGPVPPPVAPPSTGRGGGGAPAGGAGRGPAPAAPRISTLVALLAYRCVPTACATSGVVTLDAPSAVDLTASVSARNTSGLNGGTTAGTIAWTAPATPPASEWLVVSIWAQGAMAQPDLLSREGTRVLTNGMESGLLTPRIRALVAKNGSDLFYDSHSTDRGSPTDLWTNRMAEEFQERRGYSLIPVLPALLDTQFDFAGDAGARVRNDFYQVRTDLWEQNHLRPLQQWASGLGLKVRLQPYGEARPSVDAIQGAAAVARPETESLWFGDEVDNYLPIASAAHMLQNPWYSTECCAVVNASYAQNWQDTISRMHKSFAGGITKLVYHVYPYRDTPTSTWPGYHNFGQGFSNAWGPREPYWIDARLYNDYLARNQYVLMEGSAQVDVAVYMQNYLFPQPYNAGGLRYWNDTGLQEAGYTRDYLNPTLLRLPQATVRNGRLAPNGPAYKALIVSSKQLPPTPPSRTSMPRDVAEKVLALARAGLPVVIVGEPPNQVPGRDTAGDSAVRNAMTALMTLPRVKRVAEEREVPAALVALGVRPAAQPERPGPVLSVRRNAPGVNFYFLYNQGLVTTPFQTLIDPAPGAAVDVAYALEGTGRPYVLDAWTGAIRPLASYSVAAGRVTVRIRLAPEEAMLLALTPDDRFGAAPGAHAPVSEQNLVYTAAGALARRSSPAAAALPSNMGQSPAVRVDAAPAPIDLTATQWHVSVEDWQPELPYGTTGADSARTKKDRVEVDLPALRSWPDIPALQDVSGVATYTTTFTLPGSWTPAMGAYLSLGEVFDSFTVLMNGRALPAVNQLTGVADVTEFLRPGANTMSVRVATTLRNRLRTLDQTQAARPRQPYGLIGPVRITPYLDAPVTPARAPAQR